MQIKGVMGFGKTDDQSTGSVTLLSVFDVSCGMGSNSLRFFVSVGPLAVNSLLTVGPKIMVLEQYNWRKCE